MCHAVSSTNFNPLKALKIKNCHALAFLFYVPDKSRHYGNELFTLDIFFRLITSIMEVHNLPFFFLNIHSVIHHPTEWGFNESIEIFMRKQYVARCMSTNPSIPGKRYLKKAYASSKAYCKYYEILTHSSNNIRSSVNMIQADWYFPFLNPSLESFNTATHTQWERKTFSRHASKCFSFPSECTCGIDIKKIM